MEKIEEKYQDLIIDLISLVKGDKIAVDKDCLDESKNVKKVLNKKDYYKNTVSTEDKELEAKKLYKNSNITKSDNNIDDRYSLSININDDDLRERLLKYQNNLIDGGYYDENLKDNLDFGGLGEVEIVDMIKSQDSQRIKDILINIVEKNFYFEEDGNIKLSELLSEINGKYYTTFERQMKGIKNKKKYD